MFRKLIGYAVFALVAIFAIKLGFGLLGLVFNLFWALLMLAFVGFVFFLILRLLSPRSADKVEDMIKGKRSA